MPGSTTYRGNTGPFNGRVQLERDREAAREAAAEQLERAMREASPIVTPPVRRKREGAPAESAPSTKPTAEQES